VTYTPEGTFQTVCNAEAYARMILQQGGEEALSQWRALEREMLPLQQGAATFPAAALRSDLGACSHALDPHRASLSHMLSSWASQWLARD
jgi:hypothetical protein